MAYGAGGRPPQPNGYGQGYGPGYGGHRPPPPPPPPYGRPPHGHQPYGPPPRPKRKSRKSAVITVVVLAVVWGAIGVNALIQSTQDGGDTGTGGVDDPARYGVNIAAGKVKQYPTRVAGLPADGPLTDQALAGVDPRALFFAMLKRQNTEQVTDYIHVAYGDKAEYARWFPDLATEGATDLERTVVDYRTRAFTYETGNVRPGGSAGSLGLVRCVDGLPNRFQSGRGWTREELGPYTKCARLLQPGALPENAAVTDGIAAAGLTAGEADRFLSYLDAVPGLFTLDRPRAVKGSDGRPYIRLTVALNPVDPQRETTNRAAGPVLRAGFAQTGKNPDDHPFTTSYLFDNGSGRRLLYYIDPATLLPAFSVMAATPPVAADGKPADATDFRSRYDVWEYAFPRALDKKATRAAGAPRLPFRSWPFPPAQLG